MTEPHDCIEHLEYDFAKSGGWSCIIRCEKCSQEWFPTWMINDLRTKLRELEREQRFPTEEDKRGYGVACLDLEVLVRRLLNFKYKPSSRQP